MIDENGVEIKKDDYAIAVKNSLGQTCIWEGMIVALSDGQVALKVVNLDNCIEWFFPDQVAVQLENHDERCSHWQGDCGVYVPEHDGSLRKIGSTCGCED